MNKKFFVSFEDVGPQALNDKPEEEYITGYVLYSKYIEDLSKNPDGRAFFAIDIKPNEAWIGVKSALGSKDIDDPEIIASILREIADHFSRIENKLSYMS